MENLFKNKKISLGEIIIIISPFLILIIRKILLFFGIHNICLWKILTGHNCLGCGITQAIVFILKLDFLNAYQSNKFVYVVFPLLLYIWLKNVYKIVKKQYYQI